MTPLLRTEPLVGRARFPNPGHHFRFVLQDLIDQNKVDSQPQLAQLISVPGNLKLGFGETQLAPRTGLEIRSWGDICHYWPKKQRKVIYRKNKPFCRERRLKTEEWREVETRAVPEKGQQVPLPGLSPAGLVLAPGLAS